jgi:hypothetical protein
MGCVLTALVLILTISGCASAKKKFVRKKKTETKSTVMYTEKEFVRPYSNEYYYTQHYNMWRTWHQDLMKFMDGNAKSRERAGDEVLKNLNGMKQYLNEERGDLLQAEIDDVEASTRLMSGADSNRARAARSLERSYRIIQSNFETADMKPFILEDKIEL